MTGYNLLEILDSLEPAHLPYQDWLSVGMALKTEGHALSVWDEWSRRDAARYNAGECARKWEGFGGSGTPVTGGTIVQIARENGWSPVATSPSDRSFDWNDEIGPRDASVVVDHQWLEDKEIAEPSGSSWHPGAEIRKYLETLFDKSDHVGYVCDSWEKDGKHYPTKGCWDRTAEQLVAQIGKYGDDIGATFGDYKQEVGAWIRFNPLDGEGVKNENVSAFRYALVESDSMPIDRQNAIIRELELPTAVLVHSGGKSLHAIVKIDAPDYNEYKKRVNYLYDICKKNGFSIDSQNRNPSRLSRMPGVIRNGHKQFIVDTNIGKKSWDEWYEWIEGANDDLPEPENLLSVWDNLPPLSPPLIDGVLRRGHKMLLAGPSKAGKSYALIQLCCAIAEGRGWFGWHCARGRVLYVNLELERESCLNRFREVYDALGWRYDHIDNIEIWHLRGKSVPMDKLAPKLIRRAQKKNYIAIVIDPIYKVITGDENSADQMAHFCNQFDRVCSELGAAVIYCHHHSKGSQGAKRSMDRASGSGVFARDPDALLDLIELDVSDDLRKQEENKALCAACAKLLNEYGPDDWEDTVGQDDMLSASVMRAVCTRLLEARNAPDVSEYLREAEKAVGHYSAWRIDGTLREFPKFEPVNLWFTYPIHRLDDTGALSDIKADGEESPWERASKKRKESAQSKKRDANAELSNAVIEYKNLNFGESPTAKELADFTDTNLRTLQKRIQKHPYLMVDKNNGGVIVEVDEDENSQ